MILISERMYTVSEVAQLSGHRPEYVRALIIRGKLSAVRPSSVGGFGQWRVYPESLRKWLGVPASNTARRSTCRRADSDIDWLNSVSPGRAAQPRRPLA